MTPRAGADAIETGRSQRRSLTTGSLHGDIWHLAVPMMLEFGTVNVIQTILLALTVSAALGGLGLLLARPLLLLSGRRLRCCQPGQWNVVRALVPTWKMEVEGGLG